MHPRGQGIVAAIPSSTPRCEGSESTSQTIDDSSSRGPRITTPRLRTFLNIKVATFGCTARPPHRGLRRHELIRHILCLRTPRSYLGCFRHGCSTIHCGGCGRRLVSWNALDLAPSPFQSQAKPLLHVNSCACRFQIRHGNQALMRQSLGKTYVEDTMSKCSAMMRSRSCMSEGLLGEAGTPLRLPRCILCRRGCFEILPEGCTVIGLLRSVGGGEERVRM